jgi:hypothetical protein
VRPIFARSTTTRFADGYVLLTVILGLIAGVPSLLFLTSAAAGGPTR